MAPKRSLIPVDVDFSSSSASSPSNEPREDEEVTVRAKIVKTVTFKAKRSETMKNMRALINQNEDNVPENFQDLIVAGNQVNDSSRLRDYIAVGNSIVDIICRQSRININVKRITIDGTVSAGLQVELSDTILLFKSKIDAREGTKSDEYQLFFNGTQLQDDRTIGSYGLTNHAVLYMVFSPMDTLSLQIALPCGRIERLTVKPLHTIFDLKVLLQRNIQAPIDQWHLAYSDEALENQETIAYCGLEADSLLHVIVPSMRIVVLLYNGEHIPIFIKPTDNVLSLKRKIFDKKGYPVALQRLIFQGTVLFNFQKILSYGMKRNSIVRLKLNIADSAQEYCNGSTTLQRL